MEEPTTLGDWLSVLLEGVVEEGAQGWHACGDDDDIGLDAEDCLARIT